MVIASVAVWGPSEDSNMDANGARLPGMGNEKKTWRRFVPFKSAASGLVREFGVWQWLAAGIFVMLGALGAIWAWIESQLPYWAIALVFFGVVALLAVTLNQITGYRLKRKQWNAIDKMVTIDRDALATELEVIAQKIAALLGEYRGPIQEAWWKDSESRGSRAAHAGHAIMEGKLIEKYSDRHAATVWMLIRRASKVIPLDRGEIWTIEHGIRGEHDLNALYMLLANLADDIRYPTAPLPERDRRMEERQRQIASASQPPLPSSTPSPKR
jgi:membrane protein YdbS with pleckstrin-like domain